LTGNICRSPTAEAVFRSEVQKHKLTAWVSYCLSFLLCDAMVVWYMHFTCVSSSAHLSFIVSKQWNVSLCKQCSMIAETLIFWCQRFQWNFN